MFELEIVSSVFPDFEIISAIFFLLSSLNGVLEKLSINVNFLYLGSKNLYMAFAPRTDPPMPINNI